MDARECCWVGSESFLENRPPFPEGVAEVDPVTRTPSWRVPLSGTAGEDVLDGIDEEEKDVHAGVSA